jgi:hypothetical protein
MLWVIRSPFINRKIGSRKPLSYRAPSWSWAAVDGDGYPNTLAKDGILITILDVQVNTVTDDTTGQISSGFIRLQGQLVPASLYLDNVSKNPGMEVNGERLEILVHPDVFDVQEPQIDEPVYCLPVLNTTVDYNQVWGLILRKTHRVEGEYKRHGVFIAFKETRHHFDPPAITKYPSARLYENESERTIVLI